MNDFKGSGNRSYAALIVLKGVKQRRREQGLLLTNLNPGLSPQSLNTQLKEDSWKASLTCGLTNTAT